jgi:hypothetical protein
MLERGIACPLAAHPEAEAPFRADEEEFECAACGIQGDIFDWLRVRRGLSRDEAVLEAARSAIGIPPALVQANGSVEVGVLHSRRNLRVRRLG